MNLSKIRESARQSLTGKWGKAALIMLAYMFIIFILGIIEGLFEEGTILASLINIATAIISFPMSFGLVYSFIKLKRGEDIPAFEFLDNGFSNFSRAWKIYLRVALKLIVPIIVMVILTTILTAILGGTIIYSLNAVDISAIEGLSATIIIVGIAYIAIMIWFAIASLSYSLTTYIAFDNPDMTALEVVNKSKEMMNGNKVEIFLLELSFIGWAILAIFTLGIGYLWLIPYMQVSLVCFYEYLLGKDESVKTNSDNEDVIREL